MLWAWDEEALAEGVGGRLRPPPPSPWVRVTMRGCDPSESVSGVISHNNGEVTMTKRHLQSYHLSRPDQPSRPVYPNTGHAYPTRSFDLNLQKNTIH